MHEKCVLSVKTNSIFAHPLLPPISSSSFSIYLFTEIGSFCVVLAGLELAM